MTVIVRNLAAAGLVERRDDPRDARALHVALTPAGHARLAECDAAVVAIERRKTRDLNPAERQRLLDALCCCVAALADAPRAPG